MFANRSALFVALCLAISCSSHINAQCNSGASGAMPSGSVASSMALNAPSSVDSESPFSWAEQYQLYFMQTQATAYARSERMAIDQIAWREAYNRSVRPYRLARAEAKRTALANRNAARLAKRDSDVGDEYHEYQRSYSLISANQK